MSCPHNDILLSFAAGDLDPSASGPVEAHLAGGCPACERELAALAELRRIAGSDALEAPPAGVLARAQRIPEAGRRNPIAGLAGALAALVFDTLRDPLPRGARASASPSRQMLFRALDYDIDVRVTAAAPGRVRISGQVLPGPERPIDAVAGLEVALLGPSVAAAITTTNELGEFDFGPRDEGAYTLCVETGEERLLADVPPAHST
jgi:hypothetical protein